MRTLITNVRVVQPSVVGWGHILIAGERVEAILEDARGVEADRTIDGEGAYALPGLVEVHGHMREPGLTHKEDYVTGTAAAAAGGYTVFLDMPNTNPPTTTVERLHEKMDLARGRCAIDYAFIFGGAADNQHELATVSADQIVGVKFFTAGHETTPTTVADLGTLYRSLKILAGRDILALIHAENQSLIRALTDEVQASGRDDLAAYGEARGELVVATEVWNLVNLTRFLRGRVYICHVSTPGELEAIRWARARGLDMTGEAVVYHLVHSMEDSAALGALGKVSPALRTREDQRALWEALMADDGAVQVICSEHTPHTLEEKAGSIWRAASGMPGIQEALPQVIAAMAQRFPDMPQDERMRRIALWMATNPAHIVGLRGKGAIVPGNDADLVLVHPEEAWTVRREDLLSKSGWSAAEGMTLYGRPSHTFVRGTPVYASSQMVALGAGQRVSSHGSIS